MSVLTSTSFWFSVLASTTPILLATLASNMMTQSGMFNLALEGTMLISALTGVVISAYTQSLLLGLLGGLLSGILISFLLGYFALVLKGSMNACGVAINLLASGGTVFVLTMLTGSKTNSTTLPSLSFPNLDIPLIGDIPVLGPILSGHNLITYVSWLCILVAWFFLFHTKTGRNLRAVGRNEEAARAAGINVLKMRFLALTFCGVFCSLGGMYLSMGSLHCFTAGMTAYRGYTALAMDAMSMANPVLSFFSSLLYGFSDAVTVYLELYTKMDLKIISAFPYVFVIAVLILVQFIKRHLRNKKLRVEQPV